MEFDRDALERQRCLCIRSARVHSKPVRDAPAELSKKIKRQQPSQRSDPDHGEPSFGGRHFPEQRRANHFDEIDRKSTRLNSSHLVISYAVFCLKKKKKKQ